MARPNSLDRGLYERPKGSGVWYIRWADQYGKEHREKIGPKAAALKAYAKRKSNALLGKKLPELGRKELTVADLVARFAPEIQANKKSAAWDVRHGANWIKAVGEVGINQLQPGDIEKVKAKWLESLQPATVNRRLAYLKTLYGKAVRDGLTERNPVASGRVKMLREPASPERILSAEEEAATLANLEEAEQLAVLVALHTGLRISEQVERKRRDLRLAQGLLFIPDSKGGGRQEVRLDSVASKALERLLALRDSEWIFPDSTGAKHIDRGVLSRRFGRALSAANIAGVTWHTLRHTFVSRLVMLGIPIVTVQKLARHQSLQMTLKYAHLAPDYAQKALELLAEAYPAKKPTGTQTGTGD